MKYSVLLFSFILFASCATNKKIEEALAPVQAELDLANEQLGEAGEKINELMDENGKLKSDLKTNSTTLDLREEQMSDLRSQLEDVKAQRDKQLEQVGELTVLSKSANENINKTLAQLKGKDEYIQMLQAAKSKADSINLALAVNLKGALANGIADEDVNVQVDKTAVFINLSDKMLYYSGSSNLTKRAKEVLGKVAQIIQDRPDLEVMVEGNTDNVPISTDAVQDNWDLSVKRATAVVRVLVDEFDVDPARIIAAGRSEYNPVASNDDAEGRSMNRRTRMIILPKLGQFYDLLDPTAVPE
ncbi:MAG: OmpA family protein [Saprospiraceae bacterium]|jgi:chemotaxis protein MotB